MTCLRVAACLVALFFSAASMTVAGDLTYSGVPGKWRKAAKGSKDPAVETESKPKANKGTKKIVDNDRLKVTVGQKKG